MPDAKEKEILLVEDDKFLSTLLSNRLTKFDYNVVVIGDGIEAIQYLKNHKPNLILVDIILPGISGFEVLREMRSNPQLKESPVIIISNLGQDEDIKTGKELGAVEYFVKAKTPIDQLVETIGSYLKKGTK